MKRTTIIFLFLEFIVLIGICGCKKDDTVPKLYPIGEIFISWEDINGEDSTINVQGTCIISSDGGSPVISKGVCWSSSPNPTISNDHYSSKQSGIGLFYFHTKNLQMGSRYYLRAYASNDYGTGYSPDTAYQVPVINTYGWPPGMIISGPYVPEQLTPRDNSTGVSPSTTLTWKYYLYNGGADARPANPIKYTIWLDTCSNPVTIVESDTILDRNSTQHIEGMGNYYAYLTTIKLDLKLLTTYYWKIGVTDAKGDSQTSSIWSFTTGTK